MSDPKDTKPTVEEDGFISRWSRLKRGEERLPGSVEPPQALEPEQAIDTDTATPEEIEELEAIDIDAMDYGADFTAFLKKGVPEALKKRALRQLWRSSPVLANVDGLNDYDDDFNVKHTILEKFTSAYKIGTGHLTKEERANQRGEVRSKDDETEPEAEQKIGEEANADDDVAGELPDAQDEPDQLQNKPFDDVEDDGDLIG